MGHIAHLKKTQFKSINRYDYTCIITLIKRRKKIINLIIIYCFFIWSHLNPLHPRMLCAKIGWIWLSGSREENFFNFLNVYCYFVITSPGKGWALQWTNFNSLYPRMYCDKFGWIGPVVLEKKIFKFCQCIFAIS